MPAQYAVFLYRYLKEWRKNPHWSFQCCLALLLPLGDLHGEISGIAGADALKNQLQTGEIDKPTIATALKNIGAFDVTLEEGKEGDDNTIETQDIEHSHNYKGRHQGTQTELCSLYVTNFLIPDSRTELHYNVDSL